MAPRSSARSIIFPNNKKTDTFMLQLLHIVANKHITACILIGKIQHPRARINLMRIAMPWLECVTFDVKLFVAVINRKSCLDLQLHGILTGTTTIETLTSLGIMAAQLIHTPSTQKKKTRISQNNMVPKSLRGAFYWPPFCREGKACQNCSLSRIFYDRTSIGHSGEALLKPRICLYIISI